MSSTGLAFKASARAGDSRYEPAAIPALSGATISADTTALADNKLKTKSAAIARVVLRCRSSNRHGGLSVPGPELSVDLVDGRDCVRDQAGSQGSGGKGILVIVGREGEQFIKSSGARIDDQCRASPQLQYSCRTAYSLGGRNDRAMIEALIEFDPILQDYSYEGVPDIRVIVFRGVPVMAMMRCATHSSDGKANLHQGAVGVGIDMGSGPQCLCGAAQPYCQPATRILGMGFDTLQIPHWQQLLELAAGCAEFSGLDYLGVDIVLDRLRGPMLLELNARPGLAIQIANQTGLRQRLRVAEQIADGCDSADEKIALARKQFSSESTVALSDGF